MTSGVIELTTSGRNSAESATTMRMIQPHTASPVAISAGLCFSTVSVLILPSVISSMTPLVTYGAGVAQMSAQYSSELATAQAIDPATQATLQATPTDTAALTKAVTEIATTFKVSPADAQARLIALSKVPQADLLFLNAHGKEVASAATNAPGQWKTWWWVCVGGMVLFLPFIFLMTGRWSPRKAKQDADEHEAKVQAELAALQKADV